MSHPYLSDPAVALGHDRAPDTGGTMLRRRTSDAVRFLIAALALVSLALLGTAPRADAATHAGGWSPFVTATGPWLQADCKIYAGVAVDNLHPAPDFHHFGAGGVYCSSYHNIAITVRQYRYAYGVVQEVGTPGSLGPVRASAVYVPTGPACKNGDRNAQFMTQVYVTIDGVSLGWLPARWAQNTTQGCLYL
jgi:hypothetical protein